MVWLDRNSFNGLTGLNRLIRGMDQAFGSEAVTPTQSYSYPKVKVLKDKDAVLVTAKVPGIDPKEIDLNVHADKLRISGELRGRDRVEGDAYQRSERSSGKFHRELRLRFRINPGAVNATYKNGILRITLARAEEDKPKKISVTAA